MLQSLGLQRVEHDLETEPQQSQKHYLPKLNIYILVWMVRSAK